MSYEDVCYDKPCLTQAIIRFDFAEFIDSNVLFSEDVLNAIIPKFPKRGMQQLVRFQTMNIITDFNRSRTENTTLDGLQQEFQDIVGNRIILTNKSIVLEVNKYTKFETERDKVIDVLKRIVTKTQLTSIRSGIRYINEFGPGRIRPQKNYFTTPISALVDNGKQREENQQLIRSMALNEYIVGDMRLNFRYGQYNPHYPEPIGQNSFVLDYDCFCEDALSGLEDMLYHITAGHDAIQELFERSITEKLRDYMR